MTAVSHFEKQKKLLKARADGAFQNFVENFNNLIHSKMNEKEDGTERGDFMVEGEVLIETNNLNNAILHSKIVKDNVEQKVYADNMITAIHGLVELCSELRSYVLSIENTDFIS